MFFSVLGGALSFAGAAVQVAWGVTKMAVKATALAVKGAIKVGRLAYKHGKPLGRKVIKMVKSCSGAVLARTKSPQKSHIFTKPSSGSNQASSLKSTASSVITASKDLKPKQVPEKTRSMSDAKQTIATPIPVKRARVFIKDGGVSEDRGATEVVDKVAIVTTNSARDLIAGIDKAPTAKEVKPVKE